MVAKESSWRPKRKSLEGNGAVEPTCRPKRKKYKENGLPRLKNKNHSQYSIKKLYITVLSNPAQ
ncbi:hypothetical protein ABE66_19550 [Cytobacillus firmus]|nr:hypothetical protein [Cytobacillus firmus]